MKLYFNKDSGIKVFLKLILPMSIRLSVNNAIEKFYFHLGNVIKFYCVMCSEISLINVHQLNNLICQFVGFPCYLDI